MGSIRQVRERIQSILTDYARVPYAHGEIRCEKGYTLRYRCPSRYPATNNLRYHSCHGGGAS
jgi:hypothetical protein